MNAEYIQNLRYKLEKRRKKLFSANEDELFIFFHYSLKHYWFFLQDYPLIVNILDELASHFDFMRDEVKILPDSYKVYDTELENAAACYFAIQQLISLDDDLLTSTRPVFYFDRKRFKYFYIQNLHDYIDEQLDSKRVTLALLVRYKQKCEWFQKESLLKLWKDNSQKGERKLAFNLYEYIHDQGLNFTIEPCSTSGEVDLIIDQKGDYPLLVDTKIFHYKDRAASYIAKGFRQVYQYLLDYNINFGYLVIYKVCDKDLKFTVSNQSQIVPFISYNNKTIFIITIDLFIYEQSASKRGKLEPTVITENDLINTLKSEEDSKNMKIIPKVDEDQQSLISDAN